MGNKSSSFRGDRSYVFEPLVDQDQSDNAQSKIAEALYYNSSKQPEEDDDEEVEEPQLVDLSFGDDDDDGRRKTDFGQTKPKPAIEDKSNSRQTSPRFDPFCKLKRMDGWAMVVHQLSAEDTLAGLSLRYDVSTDHIRRANFMTDDRLVAFTQLLIPARPSPEGAQESPADQAVVEEKAFDSPIHRKRLVQLLAHMDTSNVGSHGAEYYLTMNNFNLRSALHEAERC